MGCLVIVSNKALVEAGARRRVWWSASTVAARTGTTMLPIDAALAGVAMGRFVAVTPEDITQRPSPVSSLISTGYCHDATGATTLRDIISTLPKPTKKG